MDQTLVVSRDGGEPVTITFDDSAHVTAAQLQAAIDEAIGPSVLHAVTDADRERWRREKREALRDYQPTEDRAGWAKVSWDDSPARLRRFHASGCRWNPATRKWSCADDCNVPRWEEEDAAADD